VPGKTPHPERSPDGHSYGVRAETVAFDPERFFKNETFLYGVDLFNCGYFWEAHAEWERCWKGAPRASPARAFLQALIQVAAASVKGRASQGAGAEKLLRKAREKLGELGRRHGRFSGVDVLNLTRRIDESLQTLESDPRRDSPEGWLRHIWLASPCAILALFELSQLFRLSLLFERLHAFD